MTILKLLLLIAFIDLIFILCNKFVNGFSMRTMLFILGGIDIALAVAYFVYRILQ
ncbi:MAG: hypothetical protein IJM03_01795 [Treponema sp.]|nr:hypothetical protein [Treponema sp.]MBR0124057.1 hypothetical protein [Treponema sp.]